MFNYKEVWLSSGNANGLLSESIIVEGKVTSSIKIDPFGRIMDYRQYGNHNHNHGWEVDHIVPVSSAGTDDPSNLQPLNWYSNRLKGDKSMDEALKEHYKNKTYADAIRHYRPS